MNKCRIVVACVVLAACILLYPNPGYTAEVRFLEPFLPPVDSGQTSTHEGLGDIYLLHQQYMQAIDEYYQAQTDSAELWNKIGVAYHHMFAMGQAKKSYIHALKLDPNYPQALNNLGAIYFAEKNYKKATKFYRRSLKKTPDAAVTYSNLGTAYFAMGKTALGIEAYRQALTLDPSVFNQDPLKMVSGTSNAQEVAQQDYCLAELFAQAGMQDRALEYLRLAFGRGFKDRNRLMQDRFFTSLRRTPEFARLMAEEQIH